MALTPGSCLGHIRNHLAARRSFASDAERLARFTREAQTLASLKHPNIAHVHGLAESDGVRALVMEMVEGDDLSERLRRGAIPLAGFVTTR